MHICYLLASTELCGGVRVVFDQARALRQRGHLVTIRSLTGDHHWYHHPIEIEYVANLSIPLKEKADVVIATFWTTVAPALKLNTCQVFHFCQGYEADFIEYADIKTEIEESYRTPIAKITIGQWVSERLSRQFGDQCFKIHTIGQIVDTQLYTPITSSDVLPTKKYFKQPGKILVIGIFEAQVKGIKYALQAVKRLKQQGLNVELTRVSSSPFSEQEKQFFRADRYLSQLTPKQMAKLYHQHDILISPSLPEEGFGLPFAEALASGLACVATRIPSSSSFNPIQDYAVFVPPQNAEAIAKAIQMLLNTPGKMALLQRKGPEVIGRQFSADAVAQRLEKLC